MPPCFFYDSYWFLLRFIYFYWFSWCSLKLNQWASSICCFHYILISWCSIASLLYIDFYEVLLTCICFSLIIINNDFRWALYMIDIHRWQKMSIVLPLTAIDLKWRLEICLWMAMDSYRFIDYRRLQLTAHWALLITNVYDWQAYQLMLSDFHWCSLFFNELQKFS